MSVGDNIRKRRQALNMSQKDVARALGVSQATMTNIENDYRIISLSLIKQIAAVLQCSHHELLVGNERKECFAYSGIGCQILTEMMCRTRDCPFFKTQLDYEVDKRIADRRTRRM
mgnify:CR=1 FL=1